MTVEISEVRTEADLAAVRTLCWGYWEFLRSYGPAEKIITDTFYPREKYAELMAKLADEHARPTGIIFLATAAGQPVGCGMSKKLSPDASEIKRVFVKDAARRAGAGRALCEALVDQARTDGFKTVFLDTSKAFAPARALYLSLGLQERAPYQPIPEIVRDTICYYELRL